MIRLALSLNKAVEQLQFQANPETIGLVSGIDDLTENAGYLAGFLTNFLPSEDGLSVLVFVERHHQFVNW